MFRKKSDQSSDQSAKANPDKSPQSDLADYVRSIQSGLTGQELQAAQAYYNQLQSRMNNGTSWYVDSTSSAPDWNNINISASNAYTYTAPTYSTGVAYTTVSPYWGVPWRETEGVESVPKVPIEKDPEIGIGIDTFLAEKKRQESK